MDSIDTLPTFLKNDSLPWMQWVKYKNEDFFACVNYDKSIKAHRPIIDLHFCITKAMNGCVIRSVNFSQQLFTKSHLNG